MSWTAERARVASLSRSRPVDDPDLLRARNDLTVSRIREYVEKAAAAAPPLTPEQRDTVIAAFGTFTTGTRGAA